MGKLNKQQVAEIRQRYFAGGVTQRELAEEYGVDPTAISRRVRKPREVTIATEGVKWCNRCRTEKAVADFAIDRERGDGRQGYCRECSNSLNRAWHHANLGQRYGLTGTYDDLLRVQDGKCANPGCSTKHTERARLHVDHDHACCPGERACGACVRGLICGACNRALGQARDDASRLRGLADYLDEYASLGKLQ